MTTPSRRGFLGLMLAAPIAAPHIVESVVKSVSHSRGVTIGQLGLQVGESVYDPIEYLRDGDYLEELTDMSDFKVVRVADDPRLQSLKVDWDAVNAPVESPTAPVGPWLQTLGGGALDLCDPKPEQICFRTIARVLSRVPRFGGHTEGGVLSVGQHCLEGAAALKRDGHSEAAQVAFLLHDAHEAYIGDITTPVAQALAAMGEVYSDGDMPRGCASNIVEGAIKSLKRRLDKAIYSAAGVTVSGESLALVHEYDRRMCVTEREHRMAPPPREWELQAPVVEGCDLWHWSAGTVEKCYLAALKEYGVRI